MKKPHPKTEPPARRLHFVWFAIGIFVVAMLVRAVHLWQIRTAPFFTLAMGDAQIYDAWARQIVKGNWLGEGIFYHPPLYAYFLAAVYSIFGSGVAVVRILQSVIGALSCVLLADTARRIFSRSTGVVAGLMLALYAPAIFFDGLFHKTTLAVFFLCLALWLLSKLRNEPRRYSLWLAVGIVIGCMILTRENALVFVIAIVLWMLLHHRKLGRQRLAFTAVFLLGLAGILLPVGLRNKLVGGQFHLTTSNFGRNLYIGNNEDAEGFYRPLLYGRGHPKYELADDTMLAEQAMGRKLTAAEVSRYWTGRALDYIVSRPGDWLKLVAKKFMLLCNATEIADTEDQYTYSEWSIPLRLTGYVCHFGVVAPLALFGVWATRNKRKKLWLLYLMPGIYTVSTLMFYVFGRYRYPIVPFLVLFASAGIVQWRALPSAKWPQRIACVMAIIATAVFCNWPMAYKDITRAMTYNNTANALVSQGEIDEAISCYRQALRTWPDYAAAHNNLGIALESRGRLSEAVSHYYQALQIKPDYFKVHSGLGRVLSMQGKLNGAVNHYRQALDIEPDDVEIHYKLGNILKSQGKLDEAISHYRQALQIAPDNAEMHYNLGNILKSQGELDEAISHYREALQLNPQAADMHNNLANTLRSQGKLDEAVRHYRQAIRNNPDYAPAHNNLAYTLISKGLLNEAFEHFQEAVRLKPDWPSPLNGLAHVLATHPDPQIRNADQAIALAERAAGLTRHQNATILNTLAASYAAAGKLGEAIATAQAALALARAQKDDELANHIRKQLETYRQAGP